MTSTSPDSSSTIVHRGRAAMSSWRSLVAIILVASGCLYAVPVERSIGLFTSTRANVSVVSSGNMHAPVGMAAVATSPTSISVTWAPSASAFAAGYELYRIGDGEPDYTLIATQFGRNNTTFDDDGLLPATGYTYYVRAFYEGWVSVPSPAAIAITPP